MDARQFRSMAQMLSCLAAQPESSFSRALGPAGRQSAGRLLSDERVSPQVILEGHQRQTRARCSQEPYVVVAQDTTEIDYSKHQESKSDLGPIGKGYSWGVLGHGCLALSPSGLPLGVVGLDLWTRDPAQMGSRSRKRDLSTEQKESRKWLTGLRSIEEALPEQPIVVVADRESDVYDYLAAPRRGTTHLVTRASYPRRVRIQPSQQKSTLFEAARAGARVGEMEVEIPRRRGQREQVLKLSLFATNVSVLRPKERKLAAEAQSVDVSVVWAVEETSEEGCGAVEWFLLSTQPVRTGADARRTVETYALRWQIEVLHRTLKTGLRIERLQIDDRHDLLNALAVYYIVAWRVLSVTHHGRHYPDSPAEEVLDDDEIDVLEQVSRCPIRTAADVVLHLAKLGGYEHWKNAPPPGPARIWWGIRRLQDILVGYHLSRSLQRQL